MAATNLFMNWSAVSVTYGTTPTVITLTGVTDFDPDAETKQEMFYGDVRKFPRLITNTEKSRSVTITGGDVYKLFAIPEDAVCTVTGTLNDAKNAAGTGAMVVTLNNAIRQKVGSKATNNKFGLASVTFMAYGDASDTDPLTITQTS